jgi:hypothetical protein
MCKIMHGMRYAAHKRGSSSQKDSKGEGEEGDDDDEDAGSQEAKLSDLDLTKDQVLHHAAPSLHLYPPLSLIPCTGIFFHACVLFLNPHAASTLQPPVFFPKPWKQGRAHTPLTLIPPVFADSVSIGEGALLATRLASNSFTSTQRRSRRCQLCS